MSVWWLVLVWIAWCLLHSLLIHPPVENRLLIRLGRGRYAYRLLYNLIAVLTLIPVGLTYLHTTATPVLIWPVWLIPLQWACWLAAAMLLWAGTQVYDTARFLGFRQWQDRSADAPGTGLAGNSGLVTSGILGRSRHPWYLAGLLLLWSRNLTVGDLVTSVVLTAYLLVGILLEERKLVRQFGAEYRRYQQRVPMLWNPFHTPDRRPPAPDDAGANRRNN